MKSFGLAAVVLAIASINVPAVQGQLLLSTNDNKVELVNGVTRVVANPPPDTLTVFDTRSWPPSVVAELDVPGSVVGPPFSVAVAPDESIALVTANEKLDPSDPTKRTANNTMSVVDLKATPPRIVATLETGRAPAGVSINRAGTLALVANRAEGTLSVFSVKNKQLEAVGKIDLGNPKALPSSVAFLPDGKTALLTRYGDNLVNVLYIDGTKVTFDERPLTTGVSPYTLDINRDGTLAAVSNMGRGNGDIDTVSLIDLTQKPLRTVETISVGHSPEGLKFSPDGKFLAVANIEGSTKSASSPFYHDHGTLVVFAVDGNSLRKMAEAPIGRWSQGIAFSKDGRTILVGSMIDHALDVFRWEGGKLSPGAKLDVGSGPAAIRTAWP